MKNNTVHSSENTSMGEILQQLYYTIEYLIPNNAKDWIQEKLNLYTLKRKASPGWTRTLSRVLMHVKAFGWQVRRIRGSIALLCFLDLSTKE